MMQKIEKSFEKANIQGDQGTEEQARQFLLAGQKNRVRAAEEELEALCAKHRVALDVFMVVRATAVARVQFVPEEGWTGDPTGDVL